MSQNRERWPRKEIELIGRQWTILKMTSGSPSIALSPITYGLVMGSCTDDRPVVQVRFVLTGGEIQMARDASPESQKHVLGVCGVLSPTELDEFDAGTDWATRKVWSEWHRLLDGIKSELRAKLLLRRKQSSKR